MTQDLAVVQDDPRHVRTIWRGMTSKGARELAEETGLTVEEVIRIRNEQLESVDALTIDQRRTKLLIDLQELSDRARMLAETTSDSRSQAPLLSASVSAIKTTLQQLDKMEQRAAGSEIQSINMLRQREIVQVFSDAFEAFLPWLTAQGIDADEATDEFMGMLSTAAMEMDRRNENRV